MHFSLALRRIVAPLVVLLAVAPAVFSGAPAGKLLRFHANEGATASYGHKLSSRLELKEEGGQKQRIETSTQAECRVEFLGGTASGDFGIRGVIEPYTVTTKVDGNENVTQASEVGARYVVNPQGRVKSVSWLSGDPMLNPEGRDLVLSPDDVFLLSGAAILPDKPVKKGDRWSGTVQVPGAVMGQDETIKYDSVLLGQEKFQGILCEKIKTSATFSFSGSEDAPDGSGRVTVSAKGTNVATWLFDAQRGVIASIDASERLTMTAKMTDGGQVAGSFAMSGVMNTRTALTQFNGTPIQ